MTQHLQPKESTGPFWLQMTFSTENCTREKSPRETLIHCMVCHPHFGCACELRNNKRKCQNHDGAQKASRAISQRSARQELHSECLGKTHCPWKFPLSLTVKNPQRKEVSSGAMQDMQIVACGDQATENCLQGKFTQHQNEP